jgi:hypothetical protein
MVLNEFSTVPDMRLVVVFLVIYQIKRQREKKEKKNKGAT